MIAYNDAGPSEPGEASEPVVIDVPGVQVSKIIFKIFIHRPTEPTPQIAPYFVLMLNDTIALEHEKVNELATVSFVDIF